jgi:alpha-glucosidase (family GH31 glycosyl hydrolase)
MPVRLSFFQRCILLLSIVLATTQIINAQKITIAGKSAQLDIRQAGKNSIRVTLKPLSYKQPYPFSPALGTNTYAGAAISLRYINNPVKKKIGTLNVEIKNHPLSITITNTNGDLVQHIYFDDENKLVFNLGESPVLGLGEGGPKPGKDVDWRTLPVQFDRRGQYDSMQPRWQADAYGSRNPVPILIGTDGWAIFVVTPWVETDLRGKDKGVFIPWKPAEKSTPQNEKNQSLNLGKGLPPADKIIPGLYDFFVFDAHDPIAFMKDFSAITGPAAMPPKWALGYMQSHRTLNDEYQMIGVVDTFRAKKIPLDAVIYLGTGFAPKGWNKKQPSFEFNPEVFKRNPREFFNDMHNRNVKVILHMVPWDRNRLPSLHGTIPAKPGEITDSAHIQNYWKQHIPLVKTGVDGFWPDEGDWFNLFERIKRHQLYYQGQLVTSPGKRPWSLQRNGFPGIAQWGGWVWSGDTESSWKTLEAQIAVGMNYSLSIGPYWGSDIGGFYSNAELTGELYARWFQFGAFCGSFRSHGRTWRTRLPWGWGAGSMEPIEDREHPLQSELNNPAIEKIAKKYTELRYQLLPYTYTLAWQARSTGLPLMRALWLHYPHDEKAKGVAMEYLWGRDLLIAPVFEKGAIERSVYLPEGDDWYNWWTTKKTKGGQSISCAADLATMPVFARAGAIIPFDPIRQYTGEQVTEPTTLKIFSGADGQFTLYEDDGISQDYLKGKSRLTKITWNDKNRTLTIENGSSKNSFWTFNQRTFNVELLPEGTIKKINYTGEKIALKF